MNPYEKGKKEARKLRGEWELTGPIKNIFQLIEEHGVDVVRWPMESDVSGCLAYVEEFDRHIVFINNREKTLGHQVFSAAHELYHWKVNPRTSVPWETFDDRSASKPNIEKAADAFAAEFLVPAPALSAVMEELDLTKNDLDPENVVRLQMRFDVSYDMMVYRLSDHGYIGETRKKKLMDVAPLSVAYRMGYDREDIFGEEKPHFPRHFRRLAIEALKNAEISAGKFKDLLRMGDEEFRKLVKDLELERHLSAEGVT